MKAIEKRLTRLEQAAKGNGDTLNGAVIDGWRYIGGPGGYLKVPVVEPGLWPCLCPVGH